MRINRRNVLFGLGTIVAGGGAALGTGAFSTVSAERDVTITTAGDGSALLQFSVDDTLNGVEDNTTTAGIIEIGLVNINREATTRFNGVLTVTNNGSKDVNLEVTGATNLSFITENGQDLTAGPETVIAGTSVTIDVEVDTIGEGDSVADETVTFVANEI